MSEEDMSGEDLENIEEVEDIDVQEARAKAEKNQNKTLSEATVKPVLEIVAKGSELKAFFDTIASIMVEARFSIENEQLRVLGMDTANVALIDTSLKKSAYIIFKAENVNETEVGFKVNDFKSVLKSVKDEMVGIKIEQNMFAVEIKGEANKVRKFSVPILTMDLAPTTKVPALDFQFIGTTSCKEFLQAIEDVEVIGSESMELSYGLGGTLVEVLSIKSENDLKKYNGSAALSGTAKKGKVKSKFSREYLAKMITKSKDMPKEFTISLGNDYPLQIEFQDNYRTVKFVLAPRVDQD